MIRFTWRWKISDLAREGHRMIVSFHAWLLFPSMHVASDDRFISFKAGEDRRDGSFFFYRAGYHMGWAYGWTKTNVAPKDVHTLFFLAVGDLWWWLYICNEPCLANLVTLGSVWLAKCNGNRNENGLLGESMVGFIYRILFGWTKQ